jgi:hypothetical protein
MTTTWQRKVKTKEDIQRQAYATTGLESCRPKRATFIRLGDEMKGWLFTRFSDGWRWHDFSDEAQPRRSANAFSSLRDCVNDATRNGYSPVATSDGGVPLQKRIMDLP